MSTNEAQELRERPIGEVARDLTRDLPLLVRQEIELAKAEMGEKARIALPGIGMIGGGVVIALCAAGAATAFLVLLFALFLDGWLAALVVTILLAVVAAALAYVGKDRVSQAGTPIPEQTLENVKEDAQWVKEHAKSGRR
jgi:VIT1/CCC1 family predicted Fe2+/Mn2+ transporter